MKRRPSICSLNNGVGDLHPDSDFVLSLFWNPRPGGRQQVREETFGGHLLCARFRVSCPGYEDEPAALLAEQLGSPSHTHTWATLETATAVGGSTQPVDTGEQDGQFCRGVRGAFWSREHILNSPMRTRGQVEKGWDVMERRHPGQRDQPIQIVWREKRKFMNT